MLSLKKKMMFSMIVTCGFVSLLWVVAELYLRTVHQDVSELSGVVPWNTESTDGLSYHWDHYHPIYGWTNHIGYDSPPSDPFHVTIDHQSLRAHSNAGHTAGSASKEIGLFGDSFVFGDEVDNDETVPFYVERLLHGSKVSNYGVHGYGVGQMALRIENETSVADLDHVMVFIGLPFDLSRDLTSLFVHPKPIFFVEDGQLKIGNQPVPREIHQPFILKYSFAANWVKRQFDGIPKEFTWQDTLDVHLAILSRIRSHLTGLQKTYSFVLITGPSWLNKKKDSQSVDKQIQWLRTEIKNAHPGAIDLIPFLEQTYGAKGASITTEHGHWSPLGNCLLAKELTNQWSSSQEGATSPIAQFDCVPGSDGADPLVQP